VKGWVKISGGAKYAGVSVKTFRAWIRDGLPITKPPRGTCLVNFEDIDAYLKRYTKSKQQVDDLVDTIMKGL
jgi:excisionase family DNA binding protein